MAVIPDGRIILKSMRERNKEFKVETSVGLHSKTLTQNDGDGGGDVLLISTRLH